MKMKMYIILFLIFTGDHYQIEIMINKTKPILINYFSIIGTV